MSYIDKTLVPGEKVVFTTRLHWIVMLGHIFGAIVLWVMGGYLVYYGYQHAEMELTSRHIAEYGGAALLVCGFIVILAGSIRRNATEMAVTTRRDVYKRQRPYTCRRSRPLGREPMCEATCGAWG